MASVSRPINQRELCPGLYDVKAFCPPTLCLFGRGVTPSIRRLMPSVTTLVTYSEFLLACTHWRRPHSIGANAHAHRRQHPQFNIMPQASTAWRRLAPRQLGVNKKPQQTGTVHACGQTEQVVKDCSLVGFHSRRGGETFMGTQSYSKLLKKPVASQSVFINTLEPTVTGAL
eukprot:SAG11_NODE_8860_length_969_cov_0.891954_1_plen_172_part_00